MIAAQARADTGGRIRAINGTAPLSLFLLDLSIEPSPDECAWLSRFEIKRAARFQAARDRARYVAAHVGLRIVVASASGVAAAAQRYERGAHGKWHLAGGSSFRFNLSYAGDSALIGIANGHEIGVDVERARIVEDVDALAAIYFNADEYGVYRRGGADHAAFLAGWTRKEACLKALGLGLQLPPIELDTGLTGDRLVMHGRSEVDVGSVRMDEFVAAWARVR